MEHKIINNIEVTVTGQISDDEASIYLTRLQGKNKFKIIKAYITVDGDHVDVNYQTVPVPFERIRRITGYLVGTTARWGDAKRSEERDRTYHN